MVLIETVLIPLEDSKMSENNYYKLLGGFIEEVSKEKEILINMGRHTAPQISSIAIMMGLVGLNLIEVLRETNISLHDIEDTLDNIEMNIRNNK